MTIIISPKDSTDYLTLEDVKTYFQEGSCFTFVFEDGSIRMYPQEHIWYIRVNSPVKDKQISNKNLFETGPR